MLPTLSTVSFYSLFLSSALRTIFNDTLSYCSTVVCHAKQNHSRRARKSISLPLYDIKYNAGGLADVQGGQLGWVSVCIMNVL